MAARSKLEPAATCSGKVCCWPVPMLGVARSALPKVLPVARPVKAPNE
jgi:hypothetical protein